MPSLRKMTNNRARIEVRRFAPAKINLWLHVTGQRPDGYHELDSLVAFASTGDEITVSPGEGLTLDITGPESAALADTENSRNLVTRAAAALAKKFGVSAGAHITLHKMLPVASGIGGGSADAAATLNALTALWQLHPAPGELAVLALELGADVPVCLGGRTMRMTGIGERLHDVPPIPVCHLVLANPGISQATPDVFRRLHKPGWKASPVAPALPSDLDFLSFVAELKLRQNDLQAPATDLLPAIADVLDELARQPGCRLARMSGSGATCFGLFSTAPEAELAAGVMANAHPQWWLQAGQLGEEEVPDLHKAYTG
jgi:4-diphosphocytidyl-2-C-methyl-D-erythritol kinase